MPGKSGNPSKPSKVTGKMTADVAKKFKQLETPVQGMNESVRLSNKTIPTRVRKVNFN
jgi:hypothetical protein